MSEPAPTLALLNVFEVERDGKTRHLIGFLDPVLAGAAGIDERAVVGEFLPDPGRGFDPKTFRGNPKFVASFTAYMNEEAAHSPDLVAQAADQPAGPLYVLDPRYRGPEGEEPAASEVLGDFTIDGRGGIVAESFHYNDSHRWFDPASGTSGVLNDRRFYDWLHPRPEAKTPRPG